MRDWTVSEDMVLLKVLEDDGLEAAVTELSRPVEAIEMRLQFLRDHDFDTGPTGEVIHRRKTTSYGHKNTTSNFNQDPPPYLSGGGLKKMNETIFKSK